MQFKLIYPILIFGLGFVCTSVAIGQTFTSSNLPIIIINTEADIPDEPKVLGNIQIIYNGSGERNNLTDFPEFFGALGIEIRGAGSQAFPKKQYSFELRDAQNEDLAAPLLGLPTEEDWILAAPYSDKSLMRNVLAFNFSALTGEYAPRTRYVELVLNNIYQGVYVLTEKIKRDKNRVDITKLKAADSTSVEVSGGYLMQIDRRLRGQREGFLSSHLTIDDNDHYPFFQFKYPKPSKISVAQADWIESYIDEFEDVLASDNFTDPEVGYAKYIDVASFINFQLVNELSQNVDGYRLSSYVHKDRDGLLRAGPVWDFNIAFGNADYNDGILTNIWRYNKALGINESYQIPFWWIKLMEDEVYKTRLSQQWTTLRQTSLSNSAITATIDSLAFLLDEAQARNFERWDILNKHVWPNVYVGGTWQNEVAWIKNWILDRAIWMDEQLLPFTRIEVEMPELFTVQSPWPNPASDQFTVQLGLPSAGVVKIELYDLLGRPVEIIHNGYLFQSDRHLFTVDVANLSAGVYFIRSTTEGASVTHPISVSGLTN